MKVIKEASGWILRGLLLFSGLCYGGLIYPSIVIHGKLAPFSYYFGGTLWDDLAVVMGLLTFLLLIILAIMPNRYLKRFWKYFFISTVSILVLSLPGTFLLLTIISLWELIIILLIEWGITLGLLLIIKSTD
ncbi:hypothetical protein ACE83Q_02675 [Dellaglioa sp. P0083]|uniref:hypothetical protein n=1 Tax=Dellaglioa kimchii TaxID=3344667 RepID=UPI0038D37EBC